jgi:hypothetical protein
MKRINTLNYQVGNSIAGDYIEKVIEYQIIQGENETRLALSLYNTFHAKGEIN